MMRIGFLLLPLFGLASSACGQEEVALGDQQATTLHVAEKPGEPELPQHAVTHDCAADVDCACAHGCHGCGPAGCSAHRRGGCGTFCAYWHYAKCAMCPHYPYFPPLHGYYYFRPYNAMHVPQQQQFVAGWGGDPRAPYTNAIFRQVYAEYEAAHAPPPQPTP